LTRKHTKTKYEQRFGQCGHIKSNYILEMWALKHTKKRLMLKLNV